MRYIYPFNGRTKEFIKKITTKVFARQKEKVSLISSKDILMLSIK
jgi:hypothetical protein